VANSDNPRTGAEFERQAQSFFAKRGLVLRPAVAVPVGGSVKRLHKFDLGSETPPVLVECKCHVWTEGGNAPSEKLTVWNEAMLYFSLAPPQYRKLLVVQRSLRVSLPLAEHYVKRYAHLIPAGVELWEFDPLSGDGRCVHGRE